MTPQNTGSSLFRSLSAADLSPVFTRLSTVMTESPACGYLPLLAAVLTGLRPQTALFFGTPDDILTCARQIIATGDLGTRCEPVSAAAPDALPPSARGASLLFADLTTTPAPIPEQVTSALAPDAVLLIHGTETVAGARIWEQLSTGHPRILFTHGQGLGLCVTGAIPPFLEPLLSSDDTVRLAPDALARLHSRLALLGRWWAEPAREQSLSHREKDLTRTIRDLRQTLAETRSALTALQENTDVRLARATRAYAEALTGWSAETLNRVRVRNEEIRCLQPVPPPRPDSLRTLLRSGARVPVRMARAALAPPQLPQLPPPLELPPLPAAPLTPDFAAAPAAPFPESDPPQPLRSGAIRRNILFVSGEPDTPGSLYRCLRNAAACETAGHIVRVRPCPQVGPDDIIPADIVVLWRVEYSPHVATLISLTKETGGLVIFDIDDLMVLPLLASISVIDGIRSVGSKTEADIHRCFSNMRATLDRSDAAFGTTETLTGHLRRLTPLAFTLPNIFDAATLRRSTMAARIRAAAGSDGLIRIGYATGTRTHQRDFAIVAPTLIALLKDHPNLRLVMFRESTNHNPVILTGEFPALNSVADQIEWRDLVPLTALPDEFARFDISIAPLETGNLFCEAKSEIKYFEAALCDVPTVASPTAPFRGCITDGVTGFLADTPEDWHAALSRLIADPALRRRLARNARNEVLWNFGPERQALLFESVIMSLGNEDATARATELMLARKGYHSRALPDVPDSQTLAAWDSFRGSADITVIITCFNYGHLITEALESVRAQTLPLLDLIIVDDGSSDDSVATITAWAERHQERFNRLLVLQSTRNAGLGGARNIGVSASTTPWFVTLDADNRLLPDACLTLRDACDPLTAYVYPAIRSFGKDDQPQKIMGNRLCRPLMLQQENHIDAMALVAKWAWSAVGGYYVSRDAMGWEDYDFWCSCAEAGLKGHHLDQIVAEYRVHDSSMTNSVTERGAHKARVVELIRQRHPWLDIHDEARQRG